MSPLTDRRIKKKITIIIARRYPSADQSVGSVTEAAPNDGIPFTSHPEAAALRSYEEELYQSIKLAPPVYINQPAPEPAPEPYPAPYSAPESYPPPVPVPESYPGPVPAPESYPPPVPVPKSYPALAPVPESHPLPVPVPGPVSEPAQLVQYPATAEYFKAVSASGSDQSAGWMYPSRSLVLCRMGIQKYGCDDPFENQIFTQWPPFGIEKLAS